MKKLVPRLIELSEGHQVEIILSIGPCTENYSDCIKHHRVRLVSGGKKGRAPQMNEGVAKAKGDILVFLHADVFPPNGFFEDIEQTISEGFDAGFFSYQFDKESFMLRINASFTKKDGVFTGGGDQCLFIKKVIFDTMGGFDENQLLMEDFEFFRRMKKAKLAYKIVQNDLLVSARKYDKNSYLRVNLSNLLLLILFWLKFPSVKLLKLHKRLIRS